MSYKLIFITNYLNPHTLSLCDNLYTLFGDDFLVLERGKFEEYRLKIGWKKVERNYTEDYLKRLEDVFSAKVVIFSGLVDKTLSKRIKSGKLTFMQSERPYKVPTNKKTYLKRIIGSFLHFKRYRCDNFYMLALGGYVKEDMNEFNNFTNKVVRFGYFPKLIELNDMKTNDKPEITWCGRMLDWKHPEAAIELCKNLINHKIDFRMNIIGSGELFGTIKEMTSEYGQYITLKESLPFEEMQAILAKSDIVLVTSDRYEGWGAIVNESMFHRCLILANSDIGSAPYLIKNSVNGYSYTNEKEFIDLGVYLATHYKDLESIRDAAKNTIESLWSSEVAANRLFKLVNDYCNKGKLNWFDQGPLSLDGDFNE